MYQRFMILGTVLLAVLVVGTAAALLIPRVRRILKKHAWSWALLLSAVCLLVILLFVRMDTMTYSRYSALFEASQVTLEAADSRQDVTAVFHRNQDRVFDPIVRNPTVFLEPRSGREIAALSFYKEKGVPFQTIAVMEADGFPHGYDYGGKTYCFCSKSLFSRNYVFHFDPAVAEALLACALSEQ